MDAKILHELFEYRDGTLLWKNAVCNVKAGSEAGSVMKNGYRSICIKGKRYYAHRLIWILHENAFSQEIDHINGVKTDNRIENLRASDSVTNKFNVTKKRNNVSGVKGVSWDKTRNLWTAHITCNKKQHNLGRFTTINEAEIVVKQAREKLHKEFANHG